MKTAAPELELYCSNLSRLTPGKLVLPGVPLFNGAIGIGAPADQPRITLDALMERDLIEVRRSDGHPFNVHHYRRDDPAGDLARPHAAFLGAVTEVILSRDNTDRWHLDGKNLTIVDAVATESFIRKIGEVSARQQQRH
jgi:hypothetical protein